MEQRLSLVTLGVRDMARARGFYERLGWRASSASNEGVTFFQAGGAVLGLYGREALAEDASLPPEGSGFAGVALAHNARSREEVDAVIAEAEAAGGTLVKAAEDVFWGGYSGYFADPDGHLWEVAWNPHFPFDAAGSLVLPD
jgi:catechol 2,3-dioxygenase-like lactoylglutathione lyase family enzyme